MILLFQLIVMVKNDINAMNDMVDAYLNGCEVVCGVRSKRDTDTFLNVLQQRIFIN